LKGEEFPVNAASARKLLIAVVLGMLILAVAIPGAGAKKHKRLRLTCDQTTEAIFNTAEQIRAQFNAKGYTIEDAPYGFLVGSGCKNIAPLTREGAAYMADVHYTDDGSPPFPGETNPYVYKYRWQWREIVNRTKKGRIRTTVTDFQCFKESREPPDYDLKELPC
jgi:hypothetical protein